MKAALEEFNIKKTLWYNERSSGSPGSFSRIRSWRFWLLLSLLLSTLLVLLLLSRPYLPNPFLLFSRPSSNLGSGDQPGDWATYGKNPGHRRYVAQPATLKGKIRWVLDPSESSDSSPAVKDGILYVGGDFKVTAAAVSNGKTLWTYRSTGPVHSSPAVAGDLLFLGLLDGRVIALNRFSGKLQWQFTTGNFIICSPVIADGFLHIGSSDGKIYTLDAKNGALIWKVQTDGPIIHAPAVKDGIVYAVSNTKKLHSLDAKTGAKRLEYYLTQNAVDAPAVTAAAVYTVPEGGRLIALKPEARQYPWSHPLKVAWIQLWMMKFPLPTPTPQPGTLWGTFTKDKKGNFVSAPAVAGERIFAGDDRGRFYALKALTGRAEWVIETGEVIATAPLIVGKTVYFGTKAGSLFGINLSDGNPQCKFPLGHPLKGELVFASGLLLARSESGLLIAVE
ncbi:MAG: PQQ-binding-like beta-propeller repeat protein [Thermodesulfobacteriota bacterium]